MTDTIFTCADHALTAPFRELGACGTFVQQGSGGVVWVVGS